ncbi:MAG: methane monooxygenase/ammonia monooxygenase subunit C [Deltaproteobacteria bacterium]|nr:methane monooxygenase/ammonia monooxygenase subunit C [Deltaproteobacteria bacterium]
MATALNTAKLSAPAQAPPVAIRSEDYHWISPTLMVLVCGIVGILMIAARLYQQVYAWSAGLDATSPEFRTYWMNLLFAQFAVEGLAAASIWGYVWFSRPKDLGRVQTREELRRFGVFVALIFCYVFAVFWAASFFGEEDASWHQTVVRDTSFTPSHIILFYWAFPIYIILGITTYLYGMTRLPRFAARHSLPWIIGVAGPFMLLPVVAYNEWAHSFWILEERFAAPVHWWFMIFAWSGLGLGGLLLQACDYLHELTTGEAQTYTAANDPAIDPALEFEREVS